MAASPYMGYKREHFLDREARPVATTVGIVRKDLDLVLGMAREAGVPLPVVAAVREILTAAHGCGYGESDFVAVADVLRALSGGPAGTGVGP